MAEAAVVRTAVLLLNWRQAELTARCLQDLVAAAPRDSAVLVIDNGSGDDSAAALPLAVAAAQQAGLRTELLLLDDNLGFAGGMNRGIAWAREQDADYVLVCNNDLRLSAGALQPLVDVLDCDPRVVAVAPTVLFPDGRVWAEGGALGFCANGLRLRGHGGSPTSERHGPEAVDFVPGACVLLRRAAVEEIGAFDERYFMYWEDVDLSRRLAARGGRVVWLPWVRVVHLGGASAGGSRSPLRKYLMACNALRYARAHGGARLWAALLLIDLPTLPLLLLRAPRAGWAKLCGLWAGLRGRAAGAADVARWHAG